VSALFASTAEVEAQARTATPEGILPAPFEAHRRLVLSALRTTRLPGLGLETLMTSYQMGWSDAEGKALDDASGKLLRPALSLWGCEVAGAPPAQALPAALAVEWIHNFTLVHDDIQDGDLLRRHRPTVWAVWGAGQGINAGDALFARAFEILSAQDGAPPARSLAAVRILARAVRRVIAGQCRDLAQERHPQISPLAYLRMARLKTGALMGAGLAAGAVLGGGGEALAATLQRAGELLGLAFQVRDDWLGLWGDPGRTGKPLGDLARRKVTYPVVAAYAGAAGAQRDRLTSLLRTQDPASTAELRGLLEELGGAELGATLGSALAARAVAVVARLGSPRRTAEFADLAGQLAGRLS
jgi:geranylgeranyl diphosphate synthase type I